MSVVEPDFEYIDEDAVDEELKCNSICFRPFTDPMVHISCKNTFCQDCIKQVKWKCPICTQTKQENGTKKDFADVNTRVVLNMLAEIPVQCIRCDKKMTRGEFVQSHKKSCLCLHGCGIPLTRDELTKHEKDCPRVQVPCPGAKYGCTAILIRADLDAHVKDCHFVHMKTIVEPLHEKNEQLQKQYDQAHKESQTLSKKCKDLEQIVKKLEQKYNGTLKDNMDLTKKQEQAEQYKKETTKRVNQLQDQISKLQQQLRAEQSKKSQEDILLQEALKEHKHRNEYDDMPDLSSGEDSDDDLPPLQDGTDSDESDGPPPLLNEDSDDDELPPLLADSDDEVEGTARNKYLVAIDGAIINYADGNRINTKYVHKDKQGNKAKVKSLTPLSIGVAVIAYNSNVIEVCTDLPNPTVLKMVGHNDEINCIIGLNKRTGGSDFMSTGVDAIRGWDVNGKNNISLPYPGNVLIQLQDGRVLSGNKTGIVHAFEHKGGQWTAKELIRDKSAVLCMVQLDKINAIAVGTEAKSVSIFGLDGKRIAILNGHTDRVLSVMQHPKGRIVSGSSDGTVRIWNKFKLYEKIPAPGFVGSIMRCDDGIAFAHGHEVQIWDVETTKPFCQRVFRNELVQAFCVL